MVFIFFLPLSLPPSLPVELFQFYNSLLINSVNIRNTLYVSVRGRIFLPFLIKKLYRGTLLAISEAHSRYISRIAFYSFFWFYSSRLSGYKKSVILNEQACNSVGFISCSKLLSFL